MGAPAIWLVDNANLGPIIPPIMILTLDAKRRLTLPASLVPAQPGDHFQAEFDAEEYAIVLRRLAKRSDWLKVLKGCPVKMDDLPPRRREYPTGNVKDFQRPGIKVFDPFTES